jgi:hypothetical protein
VKISAHSAPTVDGVDGVVPPLWTLAVASRPGETESEIGPYDFSALPHLSWKKLCPMGILPGVRRIFLGLSTVDSVTVDRVELDFHSPVVFFGCMRSV